MLTIRAMSDGKGYSSNHLEHSDYYAEGERVIGQWRGRGAELLGLSGEVKPSEFEYLRQACHPETGEFLRQRQSADRTSADGTMQSRGRSLYDFTISAPKSVSIMAVLGGDQRLLQAHQEAVNEALRELEANAASRGRNSVQVFTGDKQLLRESIARSAARKSASELARKTNPGLSHGIHRGLEAARRMVRRAAFYVLSIMERNALARDLMKQPGMQRGYDHGISR